MCKYLLVIPFIQIHPNASVHPNGKMNESMLAHVCVMDCISWLWCSPLTDLWIVAQTQVKPSAKKRWEFQSRPSGEWIWREILGTLWHGFLYQLYIFRQRISTFVPVFLVVFFLNLFYRRASLSQLFRKVCIHEWQIYNESLTLALQLSELTKLWQNQRFYHLWRPRLARKGIVVPVFFRFFSSSEIKQD